MRAYQIKCPRCGAQPEVDCVQPISPTAGSKRWGTAVCWERLAQVNKPLPKKEKLDQPLDPYEEREARLARAVEWLAWLIIVGIGGLVFVMLEVA